MTTRFTCAIVYAVTAAAIGLGSATLPEAAEPVFAPVPLAEIEPGLTGEAELDDLPAYLGAETRDRTAPLSFAAVQVAPAAMGRLSPALLAALAAFACAVLAIATRGGRHASR